MDSRDDFLINLKKLQDLKFMIYEFSNRRVDFHDFGILTLDLRTESIELDAEYKQLKKDHTIEEIAWSIVHKYDL
ncbi:hypothetical protein [Companilactobacillus kedongensis]|uniref:hypothetical protein n=1 Tax=Companilactobacillus kedongensis TaxID=2486004 RepID=UPI000F798014|nr:hypothetical protein [Companilactobacillus kedongensis]